MKSPVVKRSVALAKHKTSTSLEEDFWEALKQIAAILGLTVQIWSQKSTRTAIKEIFRRPFGFLYWPTTGIGSRTHEAT
jgi:hypothetical protein